MSLQEVSPAKQQEFIELVREQYGKSKVALRPKHEQFLEYLSLYYGERDDKRPKGMANLPVSLVQESVDSLVADLLDKIIATDLQIDTKGRERIDEPYALAIRNVIKYQAYYDKWKSKIRDILMSFVLFGNAPAKVIYTRKYSKIMRREPIYYPNMGHPSMPMAMGQQPIDSIQKFTDELIYHGATLIPIDIFDFFPHIDMTEVGDDLPIVHRFKPSQNTIIERAKTGIYENVAELLESMRDGKTTGSGDENIEQFKKRRRELTGITYNGDDSKFPELLEWQGRFDINDDGIDECCVGVVANTDDGLLLRLDQYPDYGEDKNYIVGRMFKVQNEFWGIGLVEKLINDQKAATAIRNCLLDNMYKHSQPRTYIENMALDNEQELNIPRAVVHVNADDKPITSKIYVEPVFPIGEDGYRLLGDVIASGQAKGGVNDQKAGRIPGQATTATVGSQVFAQASIRFKDILSMFEDSLLLPLCDKAHAINQQYIDKPYAIFLIGQQGGQYWQTVDPTQIAGRVNFVSLASTKNSDKTVNIEQLMRAIQVSGSNPMLAGAVPILYVALMQEWGMQNIDEIKVAIGYQAMMTQLYQAAQMQMTPYQMMALQGQQFGIPVPGQKADGNNIPYGGEQQQTPVNNEEAIASIRQPMTENIPLAR